MSTETTTQPESQQDVESLPSPPPFPFPTSIRSLDSQRPETITEGDETTVSGVKTPTHSYPPSVASEREVPALPRADYGKDAYLFLLGAFSGARLSLPPKTSTHPSEHSRNRRLGSSIVIRSFP
jgi:hypothetical protein